MLPFLSLQLHIEKLVYGGQGLSRLEGEVVFTPFVLPGEIVEAERTEARKHVQRARLLHVDTPSPDRVEPLCPVFGRCGGCQYQHAAYDAQLRFKRDILVETLRRVGKIEFDPAQIGIESAEPFGYRNRAQLHFESGRVGYREMNSRRLVAIEQCPISSPKINEIVVKLNRMVRDRRWPGFVRSLEIFTDERHVQWNVLESEQPVAKRFFDWLAEEVPGTVAGQLEYAVNEDLFQVSGTSFFQVNRFLLPRLAALAIGEARAAYRHGTSMPAWGCSHCRWRAGLNASSRWKRGGAPMICATTRDARERLLRLPGSKRRCSWQKRRRRPISSSPILPEPGWARPRPPDWRSCARQRW